LSRGSSLEAADDCLVSIVHTFDCFYFFHHHFCWCSLMSARRAACLFIRLPVCTMSACLPTCSSTCLPICLSACSLISLPACLCVSLPADMFLACLYFCPHVLLSDCLSVWLSVWLAVCVLPFFLLHIFIAFRINTHRTFIHSNIPAFIRTFIHHSFSRVFRGNKFRYVAHKKWLLTIVGLYAGHHNGVEVRSGVAQAAWAHSVDQTTQAPVYLSQAAQAPF
jgi:hypothetical protein